MTQHGNNNIQIGRVSGGNVTINTNTTRENAAFDFVGNLTKAEDYITKTQYDGAKEMLNKILNALNNVTSDERLNKMIMKRLVKLYQKLGDEIKANEIFDSL
jgi:predicted negative regulator of RcsB-dependent stress response